MKITERINIPEIELQFSYARSSGAGGQNVNKVNSKATLSWNIDLSTALPPAVEKRFKEKFAGRINKDGAIIIQSDSFRDQPRNANECLERLRKMVLEVLSPPKKRKPTKPTKSSQKKRVDTKKKRGEVKKNRQKPNW